MKVAETAGSRSTKVPAGGKPVGGKTPPPQKPTGPMTYTVSKGSNVFWTGKGAGKA